ncbi:hypothetical protein [Crocosphaera chwakensis]|nr:hypothetical protein [Crocosphaera chwakensis]
MSNSNSPLSPLIQKFINILENRNQNQSIVGRSPIEPIEMKLFWDDLPNLEDYYKYQRELISSEKSTIVFQFIRGQEEVTAELVAENTDVNLNDE